MHIGLIGGIGPAATAFYYRNIVAGTKAGGTALELTITHADNAGLVENFFADRRDQQAEIFADHIRSLAAAGAEVAVVTALAAHFCITETIAASPLPVVNAVDVIRDALLSSSPGCLGLLGSGRVMSSGLYGALDGFDQVTPADTDGVGAAYIAMAQRGSCTETERSFFFDEGARLIDAGADAVFLAGTDLFLAFEGHDPGYPVIDGGLLHIEELVRLAKNPA